jgi:hypothetical protein
MDRHNLKKCTETALFSYKSKVYEASSRLLQLIPEMDIFHPRDGQVWRAIHPRDGHLSSPRWTGIRLVSLMQQRFANPKVSKELFS